jgi:hypothetical protein
MMFGKNGGILLALATCIESYSNLISPCAVLPKDRYT